MCDGALDGPRAKIERAVEHFGNLEREIGAPDDLSPFGVVAERDPQSAQVTVRARVIPELVLRSGIIVGDIVHNLRSALDHLAWQLILAGGDPPGRNPRFPVVPGNVALPSKDYETAVHQAIQGASPAAVGIVKRLQPYHRLPDVEAVEAHPLYMLHRLDIQDKHQLLNLGVGVIQDAMLWRAEPPVGGRAYETLLATRAYARVVEDGAVLLTGTDSSGMDVYSEFTLEIVFDKAGPGKGQPILPTLQQLIDFTEQTVGLFDSFFAPPGEEA